MKNKSLAAMLSLFLVLTISIIPTYAVGGDEGAFPSTSIIGNQPIVEEEMFTTPNMEMQSLVPPITNETNFYIAGRDDGVLMGASSSSTITYEYYNTTSLSSSQLQWKIKPYSDGTVSIHPVAYPAFCLTVNESSGALALTLFQRFPLAI